MHHGIFLRFPGQWDDESWRSSSTGPGYYNLLRWYLPEIGNYSRADPIGVLGGINIVVYSASNPAKYIDPSGLAYFEKRPLAGFPWLGPASCNPVSDQRNVEVSHEQLFFEDGKDPSNLGFMDSGDVKADDASQLQRYRKPTRSRKYNDCIMRIAVDRTTAGNYSPGGYSLLGFGTAPKNNCQDWADKVREKYWELAGRNDILRRCGCDPDDV